MSEMGVLLLERRLREHAVGMPQTLVLNRQHPSFPSALRDIPRWPVQLYCHGRFPNEGPAVALVGARAASRQGMQRAHDLAAELAGSGHRIVSGGALGVDTAAHRGALAAGGYTVAVMACGLDRYYPARNQPLFDAMLAAGGAIVSPYEEGAQPIAGRFVRRNQIIAALADLVIVVEASTNSGSLHTARFASALGRRLAVVCGSPGCEALRSAGVVAIEDARDVERMLAGEMPAPMVALPKRGSPADRVLCALSAKEPRSAGAMHKELDMPVRAVQRILLSLHLDLLTVALPGGRYLRTQLAETAYSGCHAEKKQASRV